MRNSQRAVLVSLLFFCFSTAVVGSVIIWGTLNAFGTVTTLNGLPNTVSYIIYKQGTTYYVENGTSSLIVFSSADAAVAIQWAINSLAHGGKIHLKEGDYNLASAQITINHVSNLVLEGEGESTRLYVTVNHSLIRIYSSNDITLQDLHLQGDADAAKTSQTGIGITAISSNITVFHCLIESMGYDGINALYGVTNLKIAFNTVKNCKDDGINPGGGGSPGSEYTIVTENYVANCAHDGIHISDDSSGTICANNIVVGCENGIGICNSSFDLITGNIINNSTASGIRTLSGVCNNLVVDSNIINNSAKYGVDLSNSPSQSVIKGNRIRGVGATSWGIRVTHTEGGSSDYVTIQGNNIQGGARGIYVIGNCPNVMGNTVRNVTEYGIVLSGGNIYSKGIVEGNLINATVSANGMLVDMNSTIVSGNLVKGPATSTSILEGSGCDYNVFVENIVDHSISKVGAHTIIERNVGFLTEGTGIAYIASSTTVAFNHGLAGTPTLVLASFNSTAVAGWKWTATETQITITVSPTGKYTVYWYAVYKP